MLKLSEDLIREQMKILEMLSEKYHLTEYQGQICIEYNKSKIYFLNFAIKEMYLMFIPVFLTLRVKVQEIMNSMFSSEITKEETNAIGRDQLSPLLAKLFFLGIDKSKTDFDILMRKLNAERDVNKDQAIFILDLIQAFDYAVFRGQQLIMMMDDVLESGDINRAKELDDKGILPYRLIPASSEEELKEKLEEIEKKEKGQFVESREMYDLKNMRVIGEA